MKRRVRAVLSKEHMKSLLNGDPVVIRIPADAKELEIYAVVPQMPRSEFAHVLDVFFNGRKAS